MTSQARFRPRPDLESTSRVGRPPAVPWGRLTLAAKRFLSVAPTPAPVIYICGPAPNPNTLQVRPRLFWPLSELGSAP